MNYKKTQLTDEMIEIMAKARFVHVTPESLKHNHAASLSHYLSDEFALFRGSITVDDCVALDLTMRGDGQFIAFSKCSAHGSSDYLDRPDGTYYLTLREIKSIAEVMEKIQAALKS